MKQVIIVLVIIVMWTVSGYGIGAAFDVQMQCAFLGMAICAALLWSVSRDEEAWQRLTGGVYDEQRQPALYAAWILIAIPPVLLFVVLLWWITGIYRSG